VGYKQKENLPHTLCSAVTPAGGNTCIVSKEIYLMKAARNVFENREIK